MKKFILILLTLSLLIGMAGCGGGDGADAVTTTTLPEGVKPEETTIIPGSWPKDSFMSTLPALAEDADNVFHETDQPNKGNEYFMIYVKEVQYTAFFDYIYELEAMGFNYQFLNNIPENEANTAGKKLEWSANNGSLWISCSWNSTTYVNPSSNQAEAYQFMMVVRNYGTVA